MKSDSLSTTQLRRCLERMRAGDPSAPDELLRNALGRLQRLARKMLKSFPRVRRWAETDDVLQNASLRLLRALRQVRPESPREFFALATEQIRRELLDLARHFYGPEGLGARHATPPPGAVGAAADAPDPSPEPDALEDLCEFHRQVEQLPPDEREVVGLLYYQGLTQADAAVLLNVAVRTVRRRWQSALLQLHNRLREE